MDVLQEPRYPGPEPSPAQKNTTTQNESHDQLSGAPHDLRNCDDIESAVLAPPTLSPSDLHDESVSNATSLSSLSSFSSLSSLSSLSSVSCSKPVTPWSVPQSCDGAPLSTVESGGGDCLSCLIQTKNPTEPESCEAVLGLTSEFQTCSTPNISMQCLGPTPNAGRYGDQVLSDQLLSGPTHPDGANEGATEGRPLRDSESEEDPSSRNIYEGLGEEAQDWSCLESLISESRMELLDLCSRSELAVNLFCEEDVDNYMFQEEETALNTDICSLKIRYESYQDGAQERSEHVLQDDTQLNFFPSIPCGRREGPREKQDQWAEDKTDTQATPNVSPESNFLFDLSNSPEDSAESSDDSSCTGSSPDAWQARRAHGRLSRENSSSSSQLSYRLRAKRKVAYREDYLYDVDSIEGEKNAEKREKQPVEPKNERDDDWCPKRRRKSCRKEPPVIIKYIIINRFKGEKNMRVKLGKVDPSATAVRLSSDAMLQYERLAPLKAYWQRREREQREQNRLAAADKAKRLNGCKRSPSSAPPKRKHRMASRLRIQRVRAVENPPISQLPNPPNCQREHSEHTLMVLDRAKMKPGEALGEAVADCSAEVESGNTAHVVRAKSRTQEREERRKGNKTGKIKKFKSEARLRCKKLRDVEREGNATSQDLAEVSSTVPQTQSGSPDGILVAGETTTTASNVPDKCTFTPATPGSDGNVVVLPGGYLQTLLETSDSSSSTGIAYFPQQQHQQQEAGLLPITTPLPSTQSCVLSPPSESELPQSPQAASHHSHHAEIHNTRYIESNNNEPNYAVSWHSQPTNEQLPFSPDIPTQSPVMPSGFSRPLPVLAVDGTNVAEYGPVPLAGCRIPFEEPLVPESQSDPDYGMSPAGSCGDRLVSFNSLGSLSAASSNYSSLSLRDGEGEREEEMSEMNDTFLSHCSPRLVLQQNLEEVTPLRESTDLLDISNFTPDKFRHSSLSEMSPPDTPNSSPQLLGNCGKGGSFSETGGVSTCGAAELQWDHGVSTQLERDGAGNTHLLQIHTFSQEEEEEELRDQKGTKRKGGKNGQGSKKSKTPRAAKGEKAKLPRQGSRSARKIKALLEGKAAKSGARSPSSAASPTPSLGMLGPQGEWVSSAALSEDDQREFQEPSNILSNIVSGMAEVQRFMRASVEPLWGPCLSPGQHSLQSQTLKILGSPADLKKRGSASGAGRGKKGAGRGGKTPPKLLQPAFFPPLGLDCLPMPHRPAHKKMYRHKSSAKFAREELLAGKRDVKAVALTALVEKRR
ncbi:neurite extension and migration factor [Chanos chanos]|uniref:Neurite extension and migration factor n=1 Tax=Chanos chanos TaxID=29144 RepID=A0A6J2WV88_CHACN|nr:neurite extension and migration factor-like [Chanos chanos]